MNDDENQIRLNWKTLGKFAKRDEIRKKPRAYTRNQIQLILKKTLNEKTRVIILLFVSSGIRLGGIAWPLKVGDLMKLGDLYQITIYAGATKGEYITFCTPETARAIDSYLESRRRCGEKIDTESPLFRRKFDEDDSLKARTNIHAIGEDGISYLVNKALIRAGLIPPHSRPEKRHDIQRVHGFRKYFDTALINSGVNPIFKKLLMGHSVNLDDFYYDKDIEKSRQMLLDEYSKALSELTISDEERLTKKVNDLTNQKEETETMKKRITELEAEYKELSDGHEILIQLYEHDPQERNKLKLLYREADRNGTRKPGQMLYLKKSEYTKNSFAYHAYGEMSSD
jgi:integrase